MAVAMGVSKADTVVLAQVDNKLQIFDHVPWHIVVHEPDIIRGTNVDVHPSCHPDHPSSPAVVACSLDRGLDVAAATMDVVVDIVSQEVTENVSSNILTFHTKNRHQVWLLHLVVLSTSCPIEAIDSLNLKASTTCLDSAPHQISYSKINYQNQHGTYEIKKVGTITISLSEYPINFAL